jgi:putative hemolysin
MPTWPLWAVCLVLLFLRGLFAAAESAFYGISDLRARELEGAHPRRGRRLLKLRTEREATAASIRFGMVLSGFTAGALAALVPPALLDVSVRRLGESALLGWLSPLLSALIAALVGMLFEVSMRALAAGKSEAWALILSGPVLVTTRVLYPVMRVLVVPLNLVLAPFKLKVAFEAPPPPLEELEKLLAAQAAKNEVDKGAPQLIRSIFQMSDKTVRDVMVPRTDVSAVEIKTPPKRVLEVLAEENHSRLPVYSGDIDHIIGILHVRDLVPLMQNPELIVMEDLVRPAVFVPWVKPVGDLLREMQKQKIHMGVVVDEYGGFMGIVTLEDILREIVGDIGDEFEAAEEKKAFEKQPDGSWLFDALLTPADFKAAFGLELPDGSFETVGGYLASLRGSIPEVGDKFTVTGWTFIVHSKQGPRLDRIRLIRPTKPAEPQPRPASERKSDPELLPRPSPARN